ncbi:aa3-type cytochrome c oxidase subunit IV [Aliiruegeria sabulilitoris]|nr:aa3-type cytochrome c oxidase subunit IV [Aliiruegeria sabulilitoris]NDR57780.1 aa3-type cytochrome c oxidase subunit IV [Pseudoruegeria sp. M32A2M]
MSEETHKPGSMDISVQEKTFNGFISMATKGAIISILLLLFIGLVNG